MPDHFRIRLWAIIGPDKSGKSTTIGHLAYSVPVRYGTPSHGINLARGDIRRVMLRGGGYLTVFTIPQSVQEYPDPPLTPDAVGEWVESEARTLQDQLNGQRLEHIEAGWFNVLMALRRDSRAVYPAAHGYLSHFVQRGWLIQSISLVGADKHADANR
jgi:hypothetical protein